jgi:uncharacterized protein DUF1016
MKIKDINTNLLFKEIKNLLQNARKTVVQTVNTTMTQTYFEIGKVIVEHEQKGKEKAEYGAETLKNLSNQLTHEFGKGFSIRNLRNIRTFYITYSIRQTVSTESQKFNLSWSHYVLLSRFDGNERDFYEKESIINKWSLRELKRQFNSGLFERILLSTDKKAPFSSLGAKLN